MNGNGRLYRSGTDTMLGGVASGLGTYFKVDPTLVRLGFVLATIFTGGAFLAVYLAMWLLIPISGSTETEPGKIINENFNYVGAKIRNFGSGTPTQRMDNTSSNPAVPTNEPVAGQDQPQVSITTTTHTHRGMNPRAFIFIGGFFLLVNMGVFRAFNFIHWGTWWPLALIAVGAIMLSRRGR